MTDYTSKDVIDRQNNTPNAGCMIDGVFYDVRNLIHERDAWKANAEALAGEVLDRHGENASSCSPAFATYVKLKGDV